MRCSDCAKFLTCNKQNCEKVTFVKAGIIDRPKKIIKKELQELIIESGLSLKKAMGNMADAVLKFGIAIEETSRQMKAKPSKEDSLIIGYDISEDKDHTCLMVARNNGDKTIILNNFYDKEAEEIYEKLTSKEINKSIKRQPDDDFTDWLINNDRLM